MTDQDEPGGVACMGIIGIIALSFAIGGVFGWPYGALIFGSIMLFASILAS
jgi:hypothetical protein